MVKPETVDVRRSGPGTTLINLSVQPATIDHNIGVAACSILVIVDSLRW